MTITLRPDLEQWISQAIQSGAYSTADQLIEHALEMLRLADADDNKDQINEKIHRAFAEVRAARVPPGEPEHSSRKA